jgi:GTP-binding protein
MLPLHNDTTVNYCLHRSKNAGKSTLLAAASAAKPKIADYPFTTIFPNLGVCDIGDEGAGLVLCDIPGLIEGAAEGTGLGLAFLRHVRRCKVLLHVVDGNADDPIGDFIAINKELQAYDDILAQKPQVIVLNKVDIPEVQEKQEKLLEELKRISGHGRVLAISAATTYRVKELMGRLKKFVSAQPEDEEENPAEIDFSLSALDMDSDDYGTSMIKKFLSLILLCSLFVTEILIKISLLLMTCRLGSYTVIVSDPAYPGQWRVKGAYIEQVARMTHWEYPEAVERFGRQLQALGIESELIKRGAVQGDLVMVDIYDFNFSPDLTNPYIPDYLLARDAYLEEHMEDAREGNSESRQSKKRYDFMDDDVEELLSFDEDDEWNLLDVAEEMEEGEHIVPGDDLWNS